MWDVRDIEVVTTLLVQILVFWDRRRVCWCMGNEVSADLCFWVVQENDGRSFFQVSCSVCGSIKIILWFEAHFRVYTDLYQYLFLFSVLFFLMTILQSGLSIPQIERFIPLIKTVELVWVLELVVKKGEEKEGLTKGLASRHGGKIESLLH